MIDGEITQQLLGQQGGLFALGLLIGGVSGWGLCTKTMIALHVKITDDVERRLKEQDEHCKKKIDALEHRINSLEDERVQIIKDLSEK